MKMAPHKTLDRVHLEVRAIYPLLCSPWRTHAFKIIQAAIFLSHRAENQYQINLIADIMHRGRRVVHAMFYISYLTGEMVKI